MTKPMIEYPPRPKPREHDVCLRCKYWLAGRRAEYGLAQTHPAMPPQWVPLAQLRQASLKGDGRILDTSQVATCWQADCTADPIWQLRSEQHWCGRFEPRLDA